MIEYDSITFFLDIVYSRDGTVYDYCYVLAIMDADGIPEGLQVIEDPYYGEGERC